MKTKALDDVIEFKDPAVPVERFLGIYHKTTKPSNGTVQMTSSAREYLQDAFKECPKESDKSSLAYVPSLRIDDRFDKDSASLGKFASTAASHLMRLLYCPTL